MNKRITIKDVAREAGVSVATVSYVVNNRTDIRISDETRKKVLQITNLLGYTPNQSAQALATSRRRMLAIYLPVSTSVLKSAEQKYVIDFLSSFFHTKNYGIIYLDASYTERYDHADAIICYDTSSEYFYQIGDRNFVPLLALDCLLSGNRLFFQVNSDYSKIAETAQKYFCCSSYTLLTLDTPNQEKKELLSSVFPSVAYVSEYADLVSYAGRNVLVIDHVLYQAQKALTPSEAALCYQPIISLEKAEALSQCIEYALDRTSTASHDVRI